MDAINANTASGGAARVDLGVPAPMDVAAGAGGVVDGDGAGVSEPSRTPEDRRRLVVSSMSPEDIVLCVDVGPEMTSEWPRGGSGGASTSRMLVVKTALRGFVQRKASFNPRHRFAVLALGDRVTVVRPLTSDVRSVVDAIERLQPVQSQEVPSFVDEGNGEVHNSGDPPFDFPELLRCISERFPPANDPAVPERIRTGANASAAGAGIGGLGSGAGATSQVRPLVRAIIVFGRSYTRPIMPPAGAKKPALLSHSRFYLDCMYIHRQPAEEGVVCQDVFDSLLALDTNGGGGASFLLACGHNLKLLNGYLGALLAHPAQRDCQSAFFRKLDVPGGGAVSGGAGPSATRTEGYASGGGGGLGSGSSSAHGPSI